MAIHRWRVHGHVVVAVAAVVTVPMAVMKVGHVCMVVHASLVSMRVGMLARRHRMMDVIMMAVVVSVGVLVLDRLVHMKVLVALR